jgi:hypothetical protein
MNEHEYTQDALPIACSLTGAELEQRGTEVSDVFQHVEQVKELADGYAFRFAGDAVSVGKLVEFILSERACCPFFTFELVFGPNQGPVWLHLRGAEGVKDFVASAFVAPGQA